MTSKVCKKWHFKWYTEQSLCGQCGSVFIRISSWWIRCSPYLSIHPEVSRPYPWFNSSVICSPDMFLILRGFWSDNWLLAAPKDVSSSRIKKCRSRAPWIQSSSFNYSSTRQSTPSPCPTGREWSVARRMLLHNPNLPRNWEGFWIQKNHIDLFSNTPHPSYFSSLIC